ncbi:MAG: hypothetical protein KAH54_04955 [Candidatus Sabulitectum sp.]|nr:hypothetical protein [Candidatus Sabulitectum sp.]
MKIYSAIGRLLFITLLSITPNSFADSPPPNTIPIISMKTGQGVTSQDITLDVLCNLIWHNFDGIWLEGWINSGGQQYNPAVLSDSIGAFVVLAPSRLQGLNNWIPDRWARYTLAGLQASNAFMQPDSYFVYIDSTVYATSMITNINSRCNILAGDVADFDCVWYYDIFNEAPARQLGRMKDDSLAYDDYFPSMYTQDTMLTEILPSGVFSWVKWKSDSMYTGDFPSVSVCFSAIHHIDSLEWGGCVPGVIGGSLVQNANAVRAYFNTEYLEYASIGPYDTYDNFPERMDLNSYPVRMAGYTWQTGVLDTISVLGSATDLWMLEHYEEVMDSTFMPAGTDANGPYSIHYHPQGFGRTGGTAIWKIVTSPAPDTTINYAAYSYRIPSPGEFRMLCNIGLLRGAKGVFPYSIRSYTKWKDGELLHHDTGLLDEDLIEFDAPYEDWVYRERPAGAFFYAPPDSIPPWTAADGSQFDPFYTLPSRPTTTGEKEREDYLEWKFAPYARLWNSVRSTFGQIARVAPELSRLWWWFDDDHYADASIAYNATPEPQYFADPHIRVFTDSTESDCYLFYVNRFCRADNNPFAISVNASDFPRETEFSEYALDHSRRFLVEGNEVMGIYSFLDTLDAGEARLLQMFDDDGLAADIRITDPDLFPILPAKGDTLTDYRSVQGETVDILARFYNMGTGSLNRVQVYLRDDTEGIMLDTAEVSFNGLTTDSCWQCDRDDAILSWDTRTADLGVHRLRVYTEDITNEPDTEDNTARLVYIIDPADYATEILNDPWDMTEASSSPPAWKTNDIDSLLGWGSTFSDSINGMFEGTVSDDSLTTNRIYLHMPADTSEWIDGSTYNQFSLIGKSQRPALVTLCWEDSLGSTYSTFVDTITSEYQQSTILDLNSTFNWISNPIRLVWLRFSPVAGMVALPIRIGSVSLTE